MVSEETFFVFHVELLLIDVSDFSSNYGLNFTVISVLDGRFISAR